MVLKSVYIEIMLKKRYTADEMPEGPEEMETQYEQ
jgi:hypothetical protein